MITPARALAFAVLRATFEEGAFAERAFRERAEEGRLEGRERAQAQRLTYGAVQRRGTSDAAIERLAERSTRLLDPPVLAALRLGLYELLFADGTPDHAAVSQAVDLVKESGAGHAAGFANAILRRAGREREALARDLLGDDSTPEKAAIAHSAPLWLARMWWEELGPQGARSLLASINEPAEVAFRATSDREAAIEGLVAEGVNAVPAEDPWPLAPPESIVIAGRLGPAATRLVESGVLSPQSRGSAAVVEVLEPHPGDHVLDLCAGPGTKTGQIAARMGNRGETISVELDPGRAAEVAGQVRRLHLRAVTVLETDAAELEMVDAYDRVLVDAPCSDLGTLASRPDARWRKSQDAIERLTDLQGRILERAGRALRPGGTLVYSTCTVSRRENEEQVQRLLESSAADNGPRLVADDLGELAPGLASEHDRRFLQIRPDRDLTTGFFIARLSRDD